MNLRTAVIGVGTMGSRYAELIQNGEIEGLQLSALTRVKKDIRSKLIPSIESGIPNYDTAEELFDAVESGKLSLDAVIIVTPHYLHEKYSVRALKDGLHVLSDKPAGVYSAQSRRMNEAASQSGKTFGMVFHQRFYPMHIRLKEIVDTCKYGKLKRLNWTITDWYRPEKYFLSSNWHSTWSTDGGGVILNQCPHNLDMICWLFGVPQRVQAFCHEGRFHPIEVEDDVTAYFEWSNGATGTFISSTGDAPGLNRLEITFDEAIIICENDEIRVCELRPEIGMSEAEYMKTSTDFYRKLRGVTHTEIAGPAKDAYHNLLQNFSDACHNKAALIAPGTDGYKSLILSNAIYLSSWQHKMVEIPVSGTQEERLFEQQFEEILIQKGGHTE